YAAPDQGRTDSAGRKDSEENSGGRGKQVNHPGNMGDDKDTQRSDADAELEQEIRKDRKFSLAETVGRMAGPGAMKGASPATSQQQAVAEIENWLRHHMTAGNSELEAVLLRRIQASEPLNKNFDEPLAVFATFCQKALDSDYLLNELVREADVEWGRVNG